MCFFFSPNQLVCADFEYRRKKPPSLPVVADDPEGLSHVAAWKLAENDARVIAVKAPYDLDPLLLQGNLVFDLDFQPLFDSEPQRAWQVERNRRCLKSALRIDLTDSF